MPVIQNEQTGEQAWLDPTSGAMTPIKIQGTLKRVQNEETGAFGLFDPMTGQVTPESEINNEIKAMGEKVAAGPREPSPERIDQVQKSLRPKRTGPMSAVADIDIAGGKPKLVPGSPQSPQLEGLAAPAAVVAATAAFPAAPLLAPIIAGPAAYSATRALEGKEFDPVGTALSGVPIQAPKAVLRATSGLFGRGPLRNAAATMLEESRAIKTPVGNMPETAKFVKDQGLAMGQGVKTEVQGLNQLIADARAQGRNPNYGEIFRKAQQVEDKVAAAFKGKEHDLGGSLRDLKNAMYKDLATIGPEAGQALEAWKKANSILGGSEGAQRIIKALPTTLKASTIAPLYMTPAALVGGVTNLMLRLPGIGEPLARALVQNPSAISQGAWQMIVQYANPGTPGQEKE